MVIIISKDKDYIVMYGKEQNEKEHSHYAIQLLIPTKILTVNGYKTQSAVLIDSYKNHYVYGDCDILSLLINPASNIGRQIKQIFFQQTNEPIVFLNHLKMTNFTKDYNNNKLEAKVLQNTSEQIIKQLLIPTSLVKPIDERVIALKQYVKTSDLSNLQYEDAINNVFLSKSRLTHLFKDEIGIPLGKYITWQRLLHASIKLFTSKTTITRVAHEYGFADASHFSRTFKENFGISPRKVLDNNKNNDRLVHVLS